MGSHYPWHCLVDVPCWPCCYYYCCCSLLRCVSTGVSVDTLVAMKVLVVCPYLTNECDQNKTNAIKTKSIRTNRCNQKKSTQATSKQGMCRCMIVMGNECFAVMMGCRVDRCRVDLCIVFDRRMVGGQDGRGAG